MGSNLNPDDPVADLAAEDVDRLAPDRRAPARGESEPPSVERADDLPLLDPAQAERAVGMRAPAEECMISPAVVEDRDPQAVDFDRSAASLDHLIGPADGDEQRHSKALRRNSSKTKRLGLASGMPGSVELTNVSDRSLRPCFGTL
jgi:hypothetical protein